MSPLANSIVEIFSTLTLFGQGVAVFLLAILITKKFFPKEKNCQKIAKFISENYTTGIFFISAVATAGSLSFSEVANFTPCKLCWFQRIAMYPIGLISFVSMIKSDDGVKKYALPLSLIGLVIAGYHILVQTFPKALECSDEVAKCSAKEFAQYGYITIPVMAFTAFLLIALLAFFAPKTSKK
ncbi:MAG: disulfide bond formation protein B [Candidatus Levybacteria bacterium]|nr:disulfide bond formation protein B [Candidatus Levybacteria bacterium]